MNLKKLFCFLTLLAIASGIRAQNPQQADPVKMETSHDFGVIRHGRPVTYDFVVVNTGKVPLTLNNVTASCGCTTPQWSPEPVPAGGKTTITVGYNAANEGPFEKSVTLQYNDGQSKTIFIKGKVDKAQPPAPLNQSVLLLKQTL
ncbi:hypothetical protein FPE01S_02_00220 [Flavihumibacter petaseus NBRC 106054]|uniref:DUF1573 domain-containing protein n=2 Tax=Flavihumibacter TaxID=1004301 RepID=A0A0E9MYX8_9BACT|nr:hypothetical protein FPE01S_02_00220 [Flavihumibacter petaseus NBRC 106054]